MSHMLILHHTVLYIPYLCGWRIRSHVTWRAVTTIKEFFYNFILELTHWLRLALTKWPNSVDFYRTCFLSSETDPVLVMCFVQNTEQWTNSINSALLTATVHHQRIYTVRQLYNATDFILIKIEVPSMMQCMPSMCPNFICNLTTPQHPTLSMTGNTAPCCAGSERTWSQ